MTELDKARRDMNQALAAYIDAEARYNAIKAAAKTSGLEFAPKTRGGYEYVILERDGPQFQVFGRCNWPAMGGWIGTHWNNVGVNMHRDLDLMPREQS